MTVTPPLKLLEPGTFIGLPTKNRMALAPMTRSRAGEKCLANDVMLKYYVQRSTAGVVFTEGTLISSQANGWWQAPWISREEDVEAWKPIVEAVHKEGSVFLMQLWHCGRASHSDFHDGKLAVAPSAIKIENPPTIHTPKGKVPTEVPHALTIPEIKSTIEDFRVAADHAKKAGFDGVEIHCANGYLLNEFLESKTNLRTDEYGGSMENRFRIAKEVIEAVATVFPIDKIGVRLSPNGMYNDMGSPDYREMTNYVLQQLTKLNLGYVHIMDGLKFGFHNLGTPYTLSEARQQFPGTIVGNCGHTKESGETEVKQGNADFIAYGRPYISNPDLPKRFEMGWELNDDADVKMWFGPKDVQSEGYTDWKTYEEKMQAVAA